MDWIQEPCTDLSEPEAGSVCRCIGASCWGRCAPYAVCLMHIGGGCKQLSVCGVFLGG
jgi:hypothetical protein